MTSGSSFGADDHDDGHHRGAGARAAAGRLAAQFGQGGDHLAQAHAAAFPGLDGQGGVGFRRAAVAVTSGTSGYGVRHWRPSRSMRVSAWRGPQVPAA